jgi:hypothetical protein
MLLKWLRASEANQVGTALADGVVVQTDPGGSGRSGKAGAQQKDLQKFLHTFLQRVDRETQPLRLNVFKRASIANSFKWRLQEMGVEQKLVDELTQALVLRLTTRQAVPSRHEPAMALKPAQAAMPFKLCWSKPVNTTCAAITTERSSATTRF